MPITNFILTNEWQKIVNYSDTRTVIVISNRDSVNQIEITYEPNNSFLAVYTLDPLDVITFIKALGDETDKAIYARATVSTSLVQVIEQFAEVKE
jgi:hypothetical protein